MTPEFQTELLKYLFQTKDAKKYTTYLDETVFESDPVYQVLFKLWKDYIKLYKAVPSKPNFIEFFSVEWDSTNSAKATTALKKTMLNAIAEIYDPLDSDTVFIKEVIIDFAQKKLTRRLFTKNADKIANGTDKFFKQLAAAMQKIVRLKEDTDEKEANRGHYYIAEESKAAQYKIVPMATPFHALNKMTSAGGFYAPQLIVFMKGPKAFGTGFLLRLAAWDLMRGEKVFFADTENGLQDIYTRLDMTLLDCEESDLPKYTVELKKIKAQIKLRGGEFKAGHFPGGVATMDDLDAELTEAYEQTGFKPTSLYNDYIDKFVPVDKTIRETRMKIRNVYEHQHRINIKWQLRCFTISPVTTDSVGQAYYTIRDFGEDKYKAYNCHGSFALCCTDAEYKYGTMRVIPVVQRKGTGFMYNADTTCSLRVNRATNEIEELDSEAYLTIIDLDSKPDVTAAPKKSRMIDLKKVKDE